MRFGKSIKYISALIAGIYLGACSAPKDDSERSSSMADSTITINDSVGRLHNQISVNDSISISYLHNINYSIIEIKKDIIEMNKIMVAHEKRAVHTSLDSIVNSP